MTALNIKNIFQCTKTWIHTIHVPEALESFVVEPMYCVTDDSVFYIVPTLFVQAILHVVIITVSHQIAAVA